MSESAKAAAAKKYQAELDRIEKESVIVGPIADVIAGYDAPSVFCPTPDETWVSMKHSRYMLSTEKIKQPDAALLTGLLAALPPVEARIWRGTFLSPGRADKVPNWNTDKSEDCGPVMVRCDPNHYSQDARVEWWADGPTGALRVAVAFPLHSIRTLATLHGRTRTDQRTGTILEILSQDWKVTPPAKYLRFGSGSHDNYGNAVIYWPKGQEPKNYAQFILGPESLGQTA
jgi:hypothetical protein